MRWLPVAAVFAAVFLAELTRQIGAASWDTIWAEDGTVYMNDAVNASFLDALTTPYAGYLQVVPRLLIEAIVAFPVSEYAMLIAITSALFVAGCAAFVFVASAEFIESVALRFVVAVAMALVPVAALELLACFVNLHWYLLFAAFWAVLWPKTTTGRTVSSTVVTAAAALSNPATALYLPLAVVLGAHRRRRGEAVVLVILVLCTVAQALFADNSSARDQMHIAQLAPIFGYHVTASLLVGDRYVSTLWDSLGYAFTITTGAVTIAALWWGFRRASRPRRALISLCLVYSLAFFVTPLVARGTAAIWPPIAPGAGSRYFFLPGLFLLTAFCVCLDSARLTLRADGRWRWPTLVLIWACAVAVVNFGMVNDRSAGPSWSEEVKLWRSRCSAGSVPATAVAQLAVSPGWLVSIPCRKLR